MIYLDYAANHPVRKEVLEEFNKVETEFYGNATSLHALGQKSHQEYENLNRKVLELLNLNPEEYEVIYTSSATESNNTAIKGIYDSYNGFGNALLASEYEHNSVNATLSYLKDKGADVALVKTGNDGKIDLSDLEEKLKQKKVILMCLTMVESETGTIQDYKKVQELVSRYHCFLLLDATQAIGKLPVNLSGIDLVTFTPHKFGGIIGTGVLIKKRNIILTPLLHGGKSASLYRSGTTPLGLIASTEKALELALEEREEHYKKVKELSDFLVSELKKDPRIMINSKGENPYIVNFSVKNAAGGTLVDYFSKNGICISQKSACSLRNTPSKPVMAMYHDRKRALESVRVSLSYLTTKEEIEEFLKVLKEYK